MVLRKCLRKARDKTATATEFFFLTRAKMGQMRQRPWGLWGGTTMLQWNT